MLEQGWRYDSAFKSTDYCPRGLGSIPRIHIAVHNCLSLQFPGIQYPHRDTIADETPVHIT